MKKLFAFFSLFLLIGGLVKAQDAASVVWPLTTQTQDVASLSGQLEDPEITLKGLAVYGYGDFVTYMLEAGGSTEWHTAENPDVYVEYSVTPKAGSIFTANELTLALGGRGRGNMCVNVYYSTDPSFTKKTQVPYYEDTDLLNGSVDELTFSINATISAGERIYVRIYPYYRQVLSGKYLNANNISISGITETTDAEASVEWPFVNGISPVISGGLQAEDTKLGSGMEVYPSALSPVPTWEGEEFAGEAVGPPNSTSCAWTGSSVRQENMYVQFEVTPKVGATFTITDISFLIGAFTTNNMEADVYYATKEDFSDEVALETGKALLSNELDKWTYSLNVEIESTETFYLRIYPYHLSDATWKLVHLRNVTIAGTTLGATIDLPEVATNTTISSISTTFATGGGTVLNDGGGAVTARGLVWSTSQQPTIEDAKSIDGAGAGTFESGITGLSAGTTYYVRAYATNTAGTSYGDQVSFTTLAELVAPSVTTGNVSSLLNTSMVVSENVTAWGGSDVTERGVVWSVNAGPTINDTKVSSGSGLGSFSVALDGLTPEATYYIRAYATNSTGTAYGSELTVTTLATQPDVTKIVSQDGTGDYTTVSAAFEDIPSNYTGRWIIRVKPGEYHERPTLESGKVNVYLVGENAETTIITHDTYAGQDKGDGTGATWGTSNCQTMAIVADDFMAVNITIANTFVNSQEVKASGIQDTQAVALRTQGDRQSFYNCRILGYQDTYLGNSIGRAYFKDCYIEGNVDFIFGRQTVVFDNCTTYVNRNGSVLTAPATAATTKYGMVFLDCKLTAPSTDYIDFDGKNFDYFYFGRPWQGQPKSAFIRCDAPATLNEKGWTTMNSGLNPVFVEYGTTGEGGHRLEKRGNEGVVITEAEAAEYTVENVFKKDTDPSFAADWMPKNAPDDDLVSSINKPSENGVTQSYCSPNPVVDFTNIYYTLAKDSQVDILLYDINGKLLQVVASGKYAAGSHNVQLNASSLVSGIYFYSVQTESGKEAGKIIKK